MNNIKNLYHQNRAKEKSDTFFDRLTPWLVGLSLIIVIGVLPALIN